MMVAAIWSSYQKGQYDTTALSTVTYDAYNYACWAVFVFVGIMQLYNGLGEKGRSLFGLDQYVEKDISEMAGLSRRVVRLVPQCLWSLATELHSPRIMHEDYGSFTLVFFPAVDMRGYPVPKTGWFSRLVLWPNRVPRTALMREHLEYMQYLDVYGAPLPNRDPPWIAHKDFWLNRVLSESFSQDKVVRLGAKYSRALASYHVAWSVVSPGDPITDGLTTAKIAEALRGRFGLGDITAVGSGFSFAQQIRDWQATSVFPTFAPIVPPRISFISAQATPCCEPGFGDGSPDLPVDRHHMPGCIPQVSGDWRSSRMVGRTGIDPIFVGWVWKQFANDLFRLGYDLELVELNPKKCFGGGVSQCYYNFGVEATASWLDPRLLLFPTSGPNIPFQSLIPTQLGLEWAQKAQITNKHKFSIISRGVTAGSLEFTEQILTRPSPNTYVAGYTGIALPAWTDVGPMMLPLPAQRRFLFSKRRPVGQTGYDPYMRAPLNPIASHCSPRDFRVCTIFDSLSNRADTMLRSVTRRIFKAD
jgi:hypothetical protein